MNNPLLYRGYQYDYETGFYYLQSRYYDPSVGRFLNADDTGFLGISGALLGWNLFAYCESAPINKVDIEGTFGTPIQGLVLRLEELPVGYLAILLLVLLVCLTVNGINGKHMRIGQLGG